MKHSPHFDVVFSYNRYVIVNKRSKKGIAVGGKIGFLLIGGCGRDEDTTKGR
jgi:hypothetical protein